MTLECSRRTSGKEKRISDSFFRGSLSASVSDSTEQTIMKPHSTYIALEDLVSKRGVFFVAAAWCFEKWRDACRY
jgi:hypothetical protein